MSEFHIILRGAIQHSRLSLEEISARLREHGTPVSPSTLSYWQNGDNQPERAQSIVAVGALEEILGQPSGSLVALIGPRRPRGGWVPRAGADVSYDKLWKAPDALHRAMSKVDAHPDDLSSPLKVSQHMSYRVDAEGHEESLRVRRLIRADRDDTRRVLFATRCSTLPKPPVVTHAEGCSPARFRADVPSATCVFEFILDRPLRAGELAAVEFALRFPPGQVDRHVELAVRRPTRDLIMQVFFDPRKLPTSCQTFWQPRSTLPSKTVQEISLDSATPMAQYIALDPVPGQYGITWKWR
ncbi:XRE family transcriptional regulator [Alloactinosynnema sp. L-07]|uniref:XRE family transcriptional regulator n=1 Tax=Alloactinosynnema sp. L-07 TaxID=1653480 RepID=UPI001E3B4510|nr:XRE family transcriptional regulator [Alloactinosynnema sp. L-07]